MSDRDRLARFNSLLSAGLSLEQAEQKSQLNQLSSSFARHFQLFKGLTLEVGASPLRAMLQLQEVAKAQLEGRARLEVSAAAHPVVWRAAGARLNLDIHKKLAGGNFTFGGFYSLDARSHLVGSHNAKDFFRTT